MLNFKLSKVTVAHMNTTSVKVSGISFDTYSIIRVLKVLFWR